MFWVQLFLYICIKLFQAEFCNRVNFLQIRIRPEKKIRIIYFEVLNSDGNVVGKILEEHQEAIHKKIEENPRCCLKAVGKRRFTPKGKAVGGLFLLFFFKYDINIQKKMGENYEAFQIRVKLRKRGQID